MNRGFGARWRQPEDAPLHQREDRMDAQEVRPRWMVAPEGMVTPPLICLTCFALLPNDERMAAAHIARHDEQDREERLLRLLGMRLPRSRRQRRSQFDRGTVVPPVDR
jgi:hypothetical protein